MDTRFKVHHNKESYKISIQLDKEEAYLLYRILPDGHLDFYKTFVPDSGRGQGLAGKLVGEGVDFARKEGKKIKATCSYVDKYLNKDPELIELIY